MAVSEESILSRLDRLDNTVRRLEEIRGCNRSPKSSCVSTPSNGTLTSDCLTSSIDLSSKDMEKYCYSINHVIKMTEVKGSLVERMDLMEDRVLKLCLQLDGEMERERKRDQKMEKKTRRKSFKQLVRRCMIGERKRELWS